MGEHNSPYFAAGLADGQRDAQLVGSCPPAAPVGMDGERAWSWMYKRGYGRAFDGAVHHLCTPECDSEADEEAVRGMREDAPAEP